MTRMDHLKAGVWNVCRRISPALEHQLRRRFSRSYWDSTLAWKERARTVMSCPDNEFIPRTQEAGQISDGYQLMHNGLKVAVGSYYGSGPVKLLAKNRGVHEPQEERVFQEVLKVIPPGGTMVELGAYWAFYSMWFCKEVPNARVYMVEPAEVNLEFGRTNFRANGFDGHFTRAYVGGAPAIAEDGTRIICVDEFMAEHRLAHLDILHSDIQGFELEMLKGAEEVINRNGVDFMFISTHTEELHHQCEEFLTRRRFSTIASVPPSQSYSVDGVLVMRAAHAPMLGPIPISHRGSNDA